MFSQRNNPYCESLQNCIANIIIKLEFHNEIILFNFEKTQQLLLKLLKQ